MNVSHRRTLVLGATVQFSGYCSERKKMVSKPGPTVTKVSGLNFLSNSMVNFVSAVTCALILYYGRGGGPLTPTLKP